MTTTPTTVPARTGAAIPVAGGASIRIGNPYGSQVVDTWALLASDPSIAMSMSHTRATLAKLSPQVGDALYGSDRTVMMTIEDDTSPCAHDTLLAACDPERYRMLGAVGSRERVGDLHNGGHGAQRRRAQAGTDDRNDLLAR